MLKIPGNTISQFERVRILAFHQVDKSNLQIANLWSPPRVIKKEQIITWGFLTTYEGRSDSLGGTMYDENINSFENARPHRTQRYKTRCKMEISNE